MPTFNQVQKYVRDQGGSIISLRDQVSFIDLGKGDSPQITRWSVPGVAQPTDDFWDGYPELEAPPNRVTQRQLRLAMLQDGNDSDTIIAVIDAGITDPVQNAKAKIELEYAIYFDREHPTVLELAAALGYDTDAKIDELFNRASEI